MSEPEVHAIFDWFMRRREQGTLPEPEKFLDDPDPDPADDDERRAAAG